MYLFIAFLTVLTINCGLPCFGQRVNGLVINKENGAVIPYASIAFIKQNVGISTDSNGRFQFKIPRFSDTLLITSLGFEPYKIHTAEIPGNDFTIRLIPKIIQLNPVTITSKSKKPIKLAEFGRCRGTGYVYIRYAHQAA